MNARTRSLCAAAIIAGAAFAWQGGVAVVGLTDAEAQNVARSFFASSGDGLPGPYFLKAPVVAQLKGKSGTDRAAVIREMALYAKRMVSTPAFASAYNGWIKDRYQAVDHGIKVDPKADAAKFAANPDAAMKQMQNTLAASIAQGYSKVPPQTLKMLFDQDLNNWKGDKDKAKLYARGQQIAPLLTSNVEEFRKQYILLKSIDMGGPDTLAGLEQAKAGAAQMQNDQKAREEQQAWNDHRLPVELKRRLTGFVTLARTVDFTAQTRMQNGRAVFVNPAYETKPDGWKKLYRLGKEPSLAMVAVAEQWLKEL